MRSKGRVSLKDDHLRWGEEVFLPCNLRRIKDVTEVEWDAGLGRQKSFGGNGKGRTVMDRKLRMKRAGGPHSMRKESIWGWLLSRLEPYCQPCENRGVESREQILGRHGPFLDDRPSLAASPWFHGKDNGTAFGIDPNVYIVILGNTTKSAP